MTSDPSCLFCRIVAGREPASVVHEDAVCVTFLDLHPMSLGHLLVVPRRHAVHLHELLEDEAAHLFRVAHRMIRAQRAADLPWEGGNVIVNDGPAAGQHVPHVHVHVVPRVRGDRLRVLTRVARSMFGGFGRAAPRAQLDRVAQRLRR